MICIIQGGCFGDNVNSTLMLKPLKKKHPNKPIHVYTSDRYSSPFDNNPYIDQIIRTSTNSKNESLNLAFSLKPTGYDIIINSHPLKNKNWTSHLHPELGENLILAWVNALESLNIEYDYPLETEIYLTDNEISEAARFVSSIDKRNGLVLMECEGESGQSFWNHNWTNQVIDYLTKSGKTVILSCLSKLNIQNKNVHWVGDKSIRIVSGIFDHCDAFISVSRGLSNACNVRQRSKDVKWFEVVNSLACSSNVIRSDGKVFWHQNDIASFIEMLRSKL